MSTQPVEIVSIAKTAIWVEDDLLGARHVVVQHEGCDPFTYATFNYHHYYTSNALTYRAADALALQLGAVDPVEHKTRPLPALSPVAQPEPVMRSDGWLQDGGLLYRLTNDRHAENRDEINVTMADGSRSEESRMRRAGELLDRIRGAQPAEVMGGCSHAVALELDRLMLVIESAVRWQDPTHHAAVVALLKANRAALRAAPQPKEPT